MGANDRILVSDRRREPRPKGERIDAATAESAFSALDALGDVSLVCAVLDDTLDRDDFVALVAVLVARGVTTFETSQTQTVQRILDTHLAISAGQIEVLEP